MKLFVAVLVTALARGWSRIRSAPAHLTWDRFSGIAKAIFSITAKLSTAFIAIAIIILAARDLTSTRTVNIALISVPKALDENGYTPQVASEHLRDALLDYTKKANTQMGNPGLALPGELPDIIVPKVDLSLSFLVSTVRDILHFGTQQKISGEFIIQHQHLGLRLRIDGKEIYNSSEGVDSDNPDELFVAAVPKLMDQIGPYIAAVSLYNTDPDQGREKAQGLIDHLQASDENLPWAYVLLARYYMETKSDYLQAEAALRSAIKLNPSNEMAHLDLGIALSATKKYEEAIKEYKRAMELNPQFALPHAGLALLLQEQGDMAASIAEFDRALKIGPNISLVHYDLVVQT